MGTDIARPAAQLPAKRAPEVDSLLRAKLTQLAGSSIDSSAPASMMIPTLSTSELRTMAEWTARAFAPPAADELVAALHALRLQVARSREEIEDWEGTLMAYAAFLRKFPRDVVLTALDTWPERGLKSSAFWPNVAELKAYLDALMGWRLRIRAEIERVLSAKALPPPAPPSEEERSEVRAGFARIIADFAEGRKARFAAPIKGVAARIADRVKR